MNHLFALVGKQAKNAQLLLVGREKVPQQFPNGDEDLGNSSSQTRRCSIVFEGKLFNRQALLGRVTDNSHLIAQESDEEIVRALFAEHGADIFADLEGYWSLVILDAEKRQLFAARDHFGNLPLFYCNTDSCIGISSRSRPLHRIDEKAKEINKNAVMDYLLWGDVVKHNQAFYAHIHALPPAHYLLYSFDNQTLEINSYYELPYKRCKAGYNEYEEPLYIDHVRQLVLDSVKDNVGNQSRLAVGVSGGLDSSAILCSALKLKPDCRYTAFSFVNEYDTRENFWMEKIIQHTAVDWVKVSCKAQEIVEELPQLIEIQDIPIFKTSTFVQYKVMQAAKSHGFEAFLDGQGGDELFGGYTAYFPPFWQSLLSQWQIKDLMREWFHLKNADISCKNAFLLMLKNFAKKYYFSNEKLAKHIKPQELSFLNADLKNNYFRFPSPKAAQKEVLNDYLYDSYTNLLTHILRWGESSAGGFGMDCLMPFSNSKKMAEYVFSLPSTFKIHNGWGKYLLRSAMVGIIPDEVRWRRQKIGFAAPEYHWLQEIGMEIKQQISILNDAENVVDKKSLLNQWNKLYTPQNFHFQQFVFRYYSYLTWRNSLSEQVTF